MPFPLSTRKNILSDVDREAQYQTHSLFRPPFSSRTQGGHSCFSAHGGSRPRNWLLALSRRKASGVRKTEVTRHRDNLKRKFLASFAEVFVNCLAFFRAEILCGTGSVVEKMLLSRLGDKEKIG